MNCEWQRLRLVAIHNSRPDPVLLQDLTPSFLDQHPHARIDLENEGAIMRFLRSWREPRMIVDAYDTSLEEIAAKLNEYRDRALAASGAGAAG